MSSYKTPEIFTYKADGAIAADKQYCFAKFGSGDEKVVLCGAGEDAIGTIMSQPSSKDGEELEIASSNGGAKVKVAGALSRGSLIKSDVNGKAVAALDRSEALGQLDEEATGADQIVACVLF